MLACWDLARVGAQGVYSVGPQQSQEMNCDFLGQQELEAGLHLLSLLVTGWSPVMSSEYLQASLPGVH